MIDGRTWSGRGGSMSSRIGAPPRGTRPGNRRELIRLAAVDLFHEHGYARVSMSDLAAAVNITPGALYRHYPGKSSVLRDVVDVGLDEFIAALLEAAGGDLSELAERLARTSMSQRKIGLLWQRDSRSLGDADLLEFRRKVSTAHTWLTAVIADRRPELSAPHAALLAACTADVLVSVSFHHLDLPGDGLTALLADLVVRTLTFDPTACETAEDPEPPGLAEPATRRDQLVAAAGPLFAERGFAEVGLDEIGAAVGIAGPSVYKHFRSKQELLMAVLDEGNAVLRRRLATALELGTSNRGAQRAVSDGYVDLALHHSSLITTLIAETIHLDDEQRVAIRRTQRDFVDSWVELAVAGRPGADPVAVRVQVQAAISVANNIGRTRRVAAVPGLVSTVRELCWVLQQ